MKIHVTSSNKDSIKHFLGVNKPFIRAGAKVKEVTGKDGLYHCFLIIKEK